MWRTCGRTGAQDALTGWEQGRWQHQEGRAGAVQGSARAELAAEGHPQGCQMVTGLGQAGCLSAAEVARR